VSKVQASSWGLGEVKVPRELPGTEPKFSQEPVGATEIPIPRS
jgi:hypothetical protein